MQGKPYDVALVADGENLGDEAQNLSNDIEGEKVDELEHAGLRLVIRDVRQFRHQSLYSLIEGADQPSQIPVDTGSYRQRCRKGSERETHNLNRAANSVVTRRETYKLLNAGSMIRRCLYHCSWSCAVTRPLPRNLEKRATLSLRKAWLEKI